MVRNSFLAAGKSLKIQPESTLIMIGDSITDCGRDRSVGDTANAGLGNGYVSLIHALLEATYPRSCIRIFNRGVGGDTIRDLKARWKTDVIDRQPDWLAVMIGINDVWRQFDSPEPPAGYVSLAEYENTLDELIRGVRSRLKGMVLMAPFFIESNRTDPMRAKADRYGGAMRRVAGKYPGIFVDTQAAFDVLLKDMPSTALSADRVHPNLTGHVVIARAFLQAVGFNCADGEGGRGAR
jgi:lysophospholipase L1-like esterase